MTMHQTLQELTYLIGPDSALHDHKVHLTTGRYCRHHIQPKPSASSFNNRRATFQGPGGSGMKIRSYAGLILKINSRPFFLGTLLDLWENLFFPLLYHFRLSLVGTIQRLLATEPKLVQQSPDRGRAKPDTELTFNQISDHRAGPQCKFKLELSGIFVTNCLIDPFDLGSGKFFRASTTLPGTQAVPSTSAVLNPTFRRDESGVLLFDRGISKLLFNFGILWTMARTEPLRGISNNYLTSYFLVL